MLDEFSLLNFFFGELCWSSAKDLLNEDVLRLVVKSVGSSRMERFWRLVPCWRYMWSINAVASGNEVPGQSKQRIFPMSHSGNPQLPKKKFWWAVVICLRRAEVDDNLIPQISQKQDGGEQKDWLVCRGDDEHGPFGGDVREWAGDFWLPQSRWISPLTMDSVNKCST